ncbi:MAG: PqqD family protein [bacterium]|nr:PqqD family protein [bacterium]
MSSNPRQEFPVRRQVFRKSDSLVTREIAGETLLVPMRGKLARLQRIFALNPVGAHIWEQLDGTRDLAAIHRSLVETFDVSPEQAEADLVEYVAMLRDAELIVDAGRSPPPSSDPP